MKSSTIINILFALLIVAPIISFAQQPAANDSVKSKFISAAREIMINAHFCNLITLDENGKPAARILEPFEPDSNFVVWLGTNSRSRKVQQIKKNPEITLFYFDFRSYAYVSIQGIAELVNDSLDKVVYWKDEWMPFYPNNKEDYLLIKFTPKFLEILDPMNGFSGDKITWKTPSIKL